MLFTRCPECDTTFRITSEALEKAHGRVRCGRCNNIFNAHDELREQPDGTPIKHVPLEANEGAASIDERASGTALATPEPQRGHETSARDSTRAEAGAGDPCDEAPAAASGDAAGLDDGGLDARGADASDLDTDDVDDGDSAEGASEHIVLETLGPSDFESVSYEIADEGAPGTETTGTIWTLEEVEEPAPRSRRWLVAAGVAALVLAGQLVNHFRAPLAASPVLGPGVTAVYAKLGIELSPQWNVEPYEIVDSRAITEASTGGRGRLAIRLRIRNEGPRAEPPPLVKLDLLDRWQDTIATRVFEPREYMSSATDNLMRAGNVLDAELVVADPGPDAFGYELDVCVGTKERFRCSGDVVFR